MINLKHPKMVAFLPSVTAEDIKMAIDSKTGRTKLYIPGVGEILGRVSPPSTPGTPGTTILDGVQYLAKTTTSWGQPTSMLIEFSREPKCYSYCSAGIALEINREVERPGFDSEDDNYWSRMYTGEVYSPVLDEYNRYSLDNLDEMISIMMGNMEGDYVSRTEKKEYLLSQIGSSAIVRKVYKVSDVDSTTFDLTATEGTTTTTATLTIATLEAATAASAIDDDVITFTLNGVVYITTINDFNDDFTASADGAVLTPMIWVRSNSAYVKLNFYNYNAALAIALMPINATNNASDILNVGTYEGETYVTLGEGKFPSLTPERINENFRLWNSSMFPVTDLVLAQKGTKYVSYEIACENEVPNLHGASHKNGYVQRLQLIVPYAQSTKSVWDAVAGGWTVFKNESPTTPAVSLDTLLAHFTGTATTSWK